MRLKVEEKIWDMVQKYKAALAELGYSMKKIEEMAVHYEAGIRRMGRVYLGKEILFKKE